MGAPQLLGSARKGCEGYSRGTRGGTQVRLLLEGKCEANVVDALGNTPLHYAAQRGKWPHTRHTYMHTCVRRASKNAQMSVHMRV